MRLDPSSTPVDEECSMTTSADTGLVRVVHEPWRTSAEEPLLQADVPSTSGISISSRCISRDGRPWIPVSGEIHYSRVPRRRWRETLLLMRSGGIDVVSCYVIWLHHQPEQGAVDFDGDLDVAAFVELCAELGLGVVLRLGPWVHGEVRNGGFPDWVQHAPVRHRTDDPGYLDLVEPWFEALGEQLGRVCGQGGPVLAIQLENELYDQPDHLVTLRDLARSAGLLAPFYTATAWGGADLPPGQVFPLYSGYGDGFWVDADAPWDATFRQHYFMSTTWDDPGVGADVRGVDATTVEGRERDATFPPATCELGGGMATTYHRRIVPSGEDIAAVAHAKLASGSAWQGYYMFAGGTNPRGRTGFQESQDTGYPNDLPMFDYDFHAAIGSAGQLAPSHAALRRQHAFLRAFGPRIATMPASFPDLLPAIPFDSSTLRWTVRSDGSGGVLFINWHQPHVPLPTRTGVSFEIVLPERTVHVGADLAVPRGTIAHWPFGIEIGGILLGWATASLLTIVGSTLVLVAERDIDVSFGLPGDVTVLVDGLEVDGAAARIGSAAGGLLRLRSAHGSASVLVIGSRDAHRVWVLEDEDEGRDGGRRLVLCDEPLWTEGGALSVRAPSPPSPRVWQDAWIPVPVQPENAAAARRAGSIPVAGSWRRAAADPLQRYGGRAARPAVPGAEQIAERAGVWVLDDVGAASEGLRRTLRIDWAGDVAELLVEGVCVADRFWDGTPWHIDLDAIDGASGAGLELRVLPLHKDTDVWLPEPARARLRAADSALVSIDAVTLTESTVWRAAPPPVH
ncbi:beta-galactosidase [Arthrobacter antioxidans]|uniref:beta-galactosidase n=1 Tax=Arthrobacter antioxidans TaxID=2895818 RepID=UPI00300E1B98